MISEKAIFSLLFIEHAFLNTYWGLTHQILTICTKHGPISKSETQFPPFICQEQYYVKI